MKEMIFGIHAVNALLARQPERIIDIFIMKEREDTRLQQLVQKVKELRLNITLVDKQWFEKNVADVVHQGIVANIKPGKSYQENDLISLLEAHPSPFLLILDGVTDPHNLGACLRSADAAGVHAVIVPKDRSASLNATVKKVACGAAESVPLIRVTNLARTLRLLKEYNITIVGTAGEAQKTLYQTSLSGSLALIMGAEDKGMRRLTREACDYLISLPMFGLVSSLNVSVATGVCLFEIVRQRLLSQQN